MRVSARIPGEFFELTEIFFAAFRERASTCCLVRPPWVLLKAWTFEKRFVYAEGDQLCHFND